MFILPTLYPLEEKFANRSEKFFGRERFFRDN